MKLFNRRLGTSFAILIAIAGISAGCNTDMPQTGESSPQAKVQDSSTPVVQKPKREGQVGQLQRPELVQSHWLLVEGPLGIPNGGWLHVWTLLLGAIGSCLGILNMLHGRITSDENIKDISRLNDRSRALESGIQTRLKTASFESSMQQLDSRISSLESQSKLLVNELKIANAQLTSQHLNRPQSIDQPLSASDYAVSSKIDFPNTNWFAAAQPASPPQSTLFDLQAELTAAINRGDRQTVKSAIRSQLNITRESENAIATGRLTQTELEEVRGGGSYWLAMIGGDAWLYPTDLTLKGFMQLQPLKGIFHYEKQPAPDPQILTPALLEPCESHWRIAKMGSIAVPG